MIIFISPLINAQFIKGHELINVVDNINNKPAFFFNLLKDENQTYVGSNLGVFKIEDAKLMKINDQKGHVKLSKKGDKLIFSPNLVYETNTINTDLLNLPKLIEDEITSSIYQNGKLIIISKGKLMFYKKVLLKKSFIGKSIRSISQNYVGTYSGIYKKNETHLDLFPNYTNSYIREFDNEVFINYDGLYVKRDKGEGKNYRRLVDGSIDLFGNKIGFAENVEKINDSTYSIFTSTGLYISNFEDLLIPIDTSYNTSRSIDQTKFIHHFVIDDRILYYKDKTLKVVNSSFDDISEIHRFKRPVKDFSFFENHLYFINDIGVSDFYFSNENSLIESDIFHTVLAINENCLGLLSNQGFYKYEIDKNKIISLNNNEFNSKALEIFGDTIYAGSVNGLYKININDFIKYAPIKNSTKNFNVSFTISLILLLVVVVLVIILIRKPRHITKPNLLDEINNYIEENLANVTVSGIQENFSISYRKLNKISNNLSPGKLIEKKRKNKIKTLIRKGESLQEISMQTGYKIEYLKKIDFIKSLSK